MFNIKIYISALILVLLIDLPWIYFVMSKQYAQFAKEFTNLTFMVKPIPAFITYLFIAIPFATFLQGQGIINAAICGVVIYAVFAFTNYSIFEEWPIKLVLLDSIWGGVLYTLTSKILKLLQL